MRVEVLYTMEQTDNGFSEAVLNEVGTFVINHATEAERGFVGGKHVASQRAPGVRAMSRIRGNQFAREDLTTLHDFVAELSARVQAKIETLQQERDELANGALTFNAYGFLASNLRDAVRSVERHLAQMQDDFDAALAQMDIPIRQHAHA